MNLKHLKRKKTFSVLLFSNKSFLKKNKKIRFKKKTNFLKTQSSLQKNLFFSKKVNKKKSFTPSPLKKVKRNKKIKKHQVAFKNPFFYPYMEVLSPKYRSLKKHPKNLLPSQASLAPSNPPPSEIVQESSSLKSKTVSNRNQKLTLFDFVFPFPLLTQALESFFLNQRSEHTKKAYGKDLKRFVHFLKKLLPTQGHQVLDRKIIICYKDALIQEGLSPTTIDRHLATLRSVFQWLMEEELILKNPMLQVRFLKPQRYLQTQAFTDEEVRKVLKLPNLHTRTGAQHYAILMLLFYCGLRRSELCQLRTNQIQKQNTQWVLKLEGKGGKERLLVLPLPVWKAIRYAFFITKRDFKKEDYLFKPILNRRTKNTQKPLDTSMIFKIVRKYAKLAGIQKRVSPHSCRATAISNARDHHVPDRVLQEFAGWSSPSMITRYDKRRSALEDCATRVISYGNSERLPSWIHELTQAEVKQAEQTEKQKTKKQQLDLQNKDSEISGM